MVANRKRLRRSSFNRLKKHLEVFNQHHHHKKQHNGANSFETLIDESYENLLALESNSNSVDEGNGSDNEIVDVLSTEQDKYEADDSVTSKSGNLIENNDDFIAFSSDSEDELENFDHENSENEQDENAKNVRGLNPDFPWLLNHDHSKEINITDWLTTEIKDFVAYISPNKEEIEQRNHLIKMLRYLVKQLWPDSKLHVFGSYATDLYLPGSDIDVVINSKTGDKEQRQYLHDLARHLKASGFATHIEVISRTRVPIIKFVEPDSNIHVDISFERTNGIEAAKLIRNWLSVTPGMRELVLIIKQFLSTRRLNDVHTGGLGGFSIICMVYSFLQLHPRIKMNEIDISENLGVLLIEFFELYGKNFSYDEVALSFNEDEYPIYVPKAHWKALLLAKRQFSIAIQDPRDPSNNISRGSFNLGTIKKSFAGAFDLLTDKCFELNQCTFRDRIGKSILGNVIKYKGAKRDFKDERSLVVNTAIIENERFHYERKRTFKIMEGEEEQDADYESDERFLNPSEDELLTGGHDDVEMYKLDKNTIELLRTSNKKDSHGLIHVHNQNVVKVKKSGKKKKVNPEILIKKRRSSPVSKRNRQSIDILMGLLDEDEDEDGDNYNDSNDNESYIDSRSIEPSSIPPTLVSNNIKTTSKLKKTAVDAQTRRDYWLSKGKTLNSENIPGIT